MHEASSDPGSESVRLNFVHDLEDKKVCRVAEPHPTRFLEQRPSHGIEALGQSTAVSVTPVDMK